MCEYRTVRMVKRGTRSIDGAGVRLVRVIGGDDVEAFDPFLMLDAFDSNDPDDYTRGFPWHPHRGIETVTYLIEGDIEHSDSLGNSGSIGDGDCQWMTAGSGIIHQEMPKATERLLGAQLWINLPAADKMCAPGYGDINHVDVPRLEEETCTVRVLAGRYGEVRGAFQGAHVKANYLDVDMAAGGVWEYPSDEQATLFVYLVEGSASFTPENDIIEDHQAVLFNAGRTLRVKAGERGIRLLLLEARPLREPVAWGGPIVMNTQEELQEAFKELDRGDFVKHP